MEVPIIESKENPDYSVFSCLKDRPLWKLFIVMFINGMISFASSGIIIMIEKPAQDKRMGQRAALLTEIEGIKNDINVKFNDVNIDPDFIIAKIKELSETMAETKEYPEEIPWDLLNAQSFITSIQTTTGKQFMASPCPSLIV